MPRCYVGRQVDPDAAAGDVAGGARARRREFWTACGARVARLDPGARTTASSPRSRICRICSRSRWSPSSRRAKDSAEYLSNAGSGFRDFTRIAGSSPEMWRDIALANRDALLTELGAYRSALDALALSIEHGDRAALDSDAARAPPTRAALGRNGRRGIAGARANAHDGEPRPRMTRDGDTGDARRSRPDRARGRASWRCPARRASRTARCCSRRSPRARPRSTGLLDADDTARMLDALRALGVRVATNADAAAWCDGAGGAFPQRAARCSSATREPRCGR